MTHASESPQTETRQPVPARRRLVGQLLAAAYAVFAISAAARASAQMVEGFDRAPVAYLLSLFAAAVYLVATIAFRKPGLTAWRVALAACLTELVGVLAVGLWTYLDADLFPEATVWSHFGQGYGFVPLVLPFLGLAWLRHTRSESIGADR